MTIVVFLLFFAPLVFFHELGHLLFAKFFKVRVEKFSIGMGPELASFRWGETEYVFSLFPIGGFIKMYGEDLLSRDEVPEDQKTFAYNHKSPFQRFWIVFAGPLANFLLAFVLFFFLAVKGQKVQESQLFSMKKDSRLLQLGFLPGDKIVSVNNNSVSSFEEILYLSQNEITDFSLLRNTQEIPLKVSIKKNDFFALVKSDLSPGKKPVVFDREGNKKEIQNIFFLNNESEVKNFTIENKEFSCSQPLGLCLVEQGFYPADLKIKNIIIGKEADKLGIKVQDQIIKIDQEYIFSIEQLKEKLQTEKPIKITVVRNQEEKNFETTLKEKFLGIETEVEQVQEKQVLISAKNPVEALRWSYILMVKISQGILKAFYELIFKNFNFDQLGGPVSIGKMANETFQSSYTLFLRFMAIFSINLAIMNLFPIPVLDGGHILILVIEAVVRRPIPKNIIKIVYMMGSFTLIFLMGYGLFNDALRFLSIKKL